MSETVLHTDGLEQRYGPVTAIVQEHSKSRRVIDIIDSKRVSRTHAITWFPQDINDGIDDIRQEVAEGALVGKTFRQHGFEVDKVPLIQGSIELPHWLQERFSTDGTSANVSIYEFWGVKGTDRVLYGIVAEIYSPDYMPVGEPSGVYKINSSNITEAKTVHQLFKEYLTGPSLEFSFSENPDAVS